MTSGRFSGSFYFVLVAACFLVGILYSPVDAAPTGNNLAERDLPNLGPLALTSKDPKIPTVAQCTAWMNKKPAKDTCLFYTAGLSEQAQAYARGPAKKISIWDVYLPDWSVKTKQPLKTYLEKKIERKYFQITSQAFAEQCSGTVWLMIPDNLKEAPSDSIWLSHEFKAVKAKGKVTEVKRINPSGKNEKSYWKK